MKNKKAHSVRVAIAHDHALVCDGLCFILADMSEVEVVGVVDTPAAMIRLVGEQEPDVLLVEPFMREQVMLKTLMWVRGEWPAMALVALSIYEDAEHVHAAFEAGIYTYLTIRAEREAIRQAIIVATHGQALVQIESLSALVAAYGPHKHGKDEPALIGAGKPDAQQLTAREVNILQRVALGERNKEIAVFFGISEPTVKTHLANIYYKLGVDSRAPAVAVALEKGILLPSKADREA
jgi:two-component system, NarL family, response regulator YdfI